MKGYILDQLIIKDYQVRIMNSKTQPILFSETQIRKSQPFLKRGQTTSLWHEYEESGVCRATGEMN